ncbi:Protein Vhl [Sergentomyia squamirostris]
MAEEADDQVDQVLDEDGREVRSLNSVNRAFVLFHNTTNRLVELFWVNYQGRKVSYAKIAPRSAMRSDTYVTHPWLLEDFYTKERLLVSGRMIYFPIVWHQGPIDFDNLRIERQVVRVYFNLRRLETIAVETVALRLRNSRNADVLEIPLILREMIKTAHQEMYTPHPPT